MKGYAIRITWRDGKQNWLQDPLPHTTIALFPSHKAAVERRFELEQHPASAAHVRAFDVEPYPRTRA